ncbi:hypothetical protein [Stenotrophomonas sp. 278]|uniref:hypothetical protein n=1 Tax=Stenotrophomonas sp. 278 TaxID=2479851 RepID=UPI000F664A1E|nr:hypothetical protein [Stenotrophomonas sp. 278]RRU17172.1 hypothetical protein EGJ34_07465 [Stenotrophomonas sp. 278]
MPKLWAFVPNLQHFPTPLCPHCDESASRSVDRDTPPPLLRSSAARLTVEASATSVLITVEGALERLSTISARGLQTEICFADSEMETTR